MSRLRAQPASSPQRSSVATRREARELESLSCFAGGPTASSALLLMPRGAEPGCPPHGDGKVGKVDPSPYPLIFTVICLGITSGFLGMETWSTPFLYSATIFAASTVVGRVKVRAKVP